MRPEQASALLLVLAGLLGGGCRQGAWSGQASSLWQRQSPPELAQLQELDRRASQLDANNRDLHARLAESQQQIRLLRDQVALLQQRLSETASQLREAETAKQQVEKKVEALMASTRFRGGASITANNSLRRSLEAISLPGFQVRQDGDVVRIELPADQLFHPGTAQLQYGAHQILDQVAAAIARDYSRQIIGVEGHTDNGPVGVGFTSAHQLGAAQALAVLDYLDRRTPLSARQLFALSHGANHPLASNATPEGRARNRRIELVIYPETVDR